MEDDPESSSLAHSSLPECRTPLSVLCVSTNDLEHRLYLHGRYPLLSLPKSKNVIAEKNNATATATSSTTRGRLIKHPPLVVASNDLAYWLTTAPINNNIGASSTAAKSENASDLSSTSRSNVLTLYHTPFLKRDRYALQQIATLHTSITAHLQTIKRSVSIVADSWKTSLRPLDQKIQPLIKLLRNYGVEVNFEAKDNSNANNISTSLSTVMKEYIMMGHVNHSSSIANAMDQFFTGVQMNDQLIQRMERSLLASMANVESTAIRCLLRPTQALGWQIQELGGLVQFFYNISDEDDEDDDDDNETVTSTNDSRSNDDKRLLVQELTDATEELWISVENVMTFIVAGRMLVRDFCGWLRHAGSQVKARGTAPNSVQRENAKKRRIAQAVLERLVTVLNKSGQRELFFERKDEKQQQIGLSETLMNLKVTVSIEG
jgi:phenylpyruvate tautomerase PptA (4-oxalocrotonate tautomerase family)